MRQIKRGFLFFIGIAISGIVFLSLTVPNPIKVYSCANQNSSFKSGETLIYKAYYNWKIVWVPAGEVRFTVEELENEYRFTALGKSYSSYDNFFRVNDYYSTVVDKHTMMPVTFVRNIEEGKYRKYDSLSFDQKNLQIFSFNGKTREHTKEEIFPIDSCSLDLLSVMYSLRNTPVEEYKEGDFLDITMFIDRELYPIHVIYEKKEKKKVKGLGKFSSLKVKPELIVGNVFKEGDVMNIWVTDDENKVPLLIESPVNVGSVKAVLKSYSGLRSESILYRND